MKKFVVLFLTAIFLLSMSGTAFAVGANVYAPKPVIKSVDDMDLSLYTGEWDNVCGIVDMFLPTDWVEMPDMEDTDDGLYLAMSSKDQSMIMTLFYYSEELLKKEGITAEEALKQVIDEAGGVEAVVNGMDCVMFAQYDTEPLMNGLAFTDDFGAVCLLVIGIDGSEATMGYANTMLYSVCPAGKGGFVKTENSEVAESMPAYKALDTDVPYNSNCVVDEIGWLKDAAGLGEQLKDFYALTGCQPYIYLKQYSQELSTQAEQQTWARNFYDTNFANAPHTIMYVYFCDEAEEGYGMDIIWVGSESGKVFGMEIQQLFWSNLDYYWETWDYNDNDGMYLQTFMETAKAVFTL